MSNNGKKLFIIAFFGLLVCAGAVDTIWAQRPTNPQIKLPALLMPTPAIEWKKYEENVKRGNKTMKAGITFTVTNWSKYGDVLFKPTNAQPVCGTSGEDTRMKLELFEVQTDQMVYTDCAVNVERLKSNTFYILPENKIPVCVYAVLTDRDTGRTVKSNWMDLKGGKVCFKTMNDTSEEPQTTTVVSPKKP